MDSKTNCQKKKKKKYRVSISLKPIFTFSSNVMYSVEVLLLNVFYLFMWIHVMVAQIGPVTEEMMNHYKEINDYLANVRLNVKYKSTDGDISFDSMYSSF